MKFYNTNLYKFVLIGIVCALLFWIFLAAPELKHNFISNDLILEQRGVDQIVSNYGGELSEPFVIEEITKISHTPTNDNLMLISATVSGTNLEKNELIFEFDESFLINPKTGKHSDESLGYFYLPFNVEKKDYLVYNPIVTAPATFVYEGDDEFYSLSVYHFSCDTENNDLTDAFPQFSPHQIFINYECDIWIEPITGNIIHYKSSWDTYFVEDGIRTLQAEIGGKENSETTIISLVEITKREIQTIKFYEFIVPMLIGIIGIIILSSFSIKKLLEKSKKLEQSEKLLTKKSKSLQEDKLKLLGTLTSVLLHDIKNPLTILANESFLLKEDLGEIDEKTTKSFTRLDTAINRIIDQSESVMNFIKEKQIDIQKNDLSEMINDSISTTNIPNTINLNLDISKQEIECDRTLIINSFSNLLKNAVDATKNGDISIQTIDKGNFIEISFKDSGSGILDDNLEKIFEYFSTTKHHGTGIGLAECKTTIEMHGGTINVKNNDGRGATFTILIPKQQKSFDIS